MYRIFLHIIVLLFSLNIFTSTSAASPPKDRLNVLLLFSWHKDMPWQISVEKGLKQKLLANKSLDNLYVEYLDSGRFSPAETRDIYIDLLQKKYASTHLDMIIAEDFSAAMIMKEVDDLFPGSQKLLIHDFSNNLLPEKQNSWNITVLQDLKTAITTMIDIYNPAQIVVITDIQDEAGKQRLANFKEQLDILDITLPVEFLTGPTLIDILEKTSRLPEKSAIFMLPYFNAGQNEKVIPYKVAEKLAETANAPIFTHWNTLMGSGVVGGYLLSGEKIGEKVADTILTFNNNRSLPQTDPNTPDVDFFEHQYDWRQLKKWNISKDQLPENSRIFYCSPSFYKKYRFELILLGSFFSFLSIFLVLLIFEIQRRNKIADQLTASKNHLNAIVEAANPIVVYATTGEVINVNTAFQNKIGWSLSEIGQWHAPFVARNRQQIVQSLLQEVLTTGELQRILLDVVSKDGHKMVMVASAAAITTSSSQTTGVVLNLTDITEQKQAELSLKASEEKFSKAFNSSPHMMTINSIQTGKYLDANDAWLKATGYSKEAILEQPSAGLGLVSDEIWAIILDQISKEGKVQDLELRLKRIDGSEIICLYQGELIEVEGEQRLLSIGNDITQQKKLEATLIKSEQKYRSLFEESNDGIFLLNSEGTILETNSRARDILGYSTAELEGNDLTILHPADRIARSQAAMEETILTGTEWFESIMKRKDDKLINVEVSASLVETSPPLIQGIVRDITEKKALEEQFRQSQKMESIGTLAGGIAHDFNNILSPILGLSAILQEDFAKDSTEYEFIKNIHISGQRAAELVKQILAFSRQVENSAIPLNIQPILKEVLKLCRSTIPRDIDITHSIDSNCGTILSDPTQLHQIAMNLITNAFHAVEEVGGSISVALKEIVIEEDEQTASSMPSGRYAKLTCSDTGKGMEAAIVSKIFDPYFSTKEQGKGTGLGLSVVYGIVKKHGGDIHIESAVNEGTTVTILFPIVEGQAPTVLDDPEGSLHQGSEHILLIDDEVAVVKMMGEMLKRLGYTVTARTTSTDALQLFSENPDHFDMVISDMAMPELPGDKLAEQILSVKPEMPIIICTGFSERIDEQRARELGIKGFLFKPVLKAELAQTIKKVLQQ